MADVRHDIARYRKGELTPAEMHALEKRALSDPFLAEALEGASFVSADDFAADVAGLRLSLKNRTEEKRDRGAFIRMKWPLRIAAGLLLLAVSTYLIVFYSGTATKNEATQDQLALNHPDDQPLLEEKAPAAPAIRTTFSLI